MDHQNEAGDPLNTRLSWNASQSDKSRQSSYGYDLPDNYNPLRGPERLYEEGSDGKSETDQSSLMEIDEPRSPAERIPTDAVAKIYEYLLIDEICRVRQVSSLWNEAASETFFRRQLRERNPYRPIDRGLGVGFALAVPSPHWLKKIVASQILENHFRRFTRNPGAAASPTRVVCVEASATAEKGADYLEIYTLEAARWVCRFFDDHISANRTGSPSDLFPCPSVPPLFFENMHDLLSRNPASKEVNLVVTKALGVLAISDTNRPYCRSLVEPLLHLVTGPLKDDADAMGNAMWALVILGRPLGGVEGEAYTEKGERNFLNVNAFGEAGGVLILLELLDRHAGRPGILAKAFWLMVNLALVDDIKRELVASGALERMKRAMVRFPNHERLQYRACFALINLSIIHESKTKILQLQMIPLIVKAATTFESDILMQRTFCHVVRSLLARSEDATLSQELRNQGVSTRLDKMIANFPTKRDLVLAAERTKHHLWNGPI